MGNLTNPDKVITVSNLNYFKSRLSSFADVYVGVGSAYTDAMIEANHHDSLSNGTLVSVTASSNSLWVILPDSFSPTVQMGGLNVPMTAQTPVTSGGVTYKVLKSDNTYSGTFSISLT